MRSTLETWISDADRLRHHTLFGSLATPIDLAYQFDRRADFYISLVGELFHRMHEGYSDRKYWAQLGNAFSEFTAEDRRSELTQLGISLEDATIFSAAAFYLGGFPASAYLIAKNSPRPTENEFALCCYELLGKFVAASPVLADLLFALRSGDREHIEGVKAHISDLADSTLELGPSHWIPLRLLQTLLERFSKTNIRAVLPDGFSAFWTPLVSSFLDRKPGTWDFFPSQIQAIESGFLERRETYSLQMPTGAGKTALCETLIYWHAKVHPDSVAVMLVPYRSLASELRKSLVTHLNGMGISSMCSYGGTIPNGNENRSYEDLQVLIATPETLSGILSANADFLRRISLVICDEGHLLDAPGRGIGLELLLARMKARTTQPPRFVFVSAIVPNIEEINLWLGGTAESVVKSNHRPAIAEFSVLRVSGTGSSPIVDLEVHPHESSPTRYRIENFLQRQDFQWVSPSATRPKLYAFGTHKCRAIAVARKMLPRGTVVVFSANKRGNEGVIGLAEELLNQLKNPLGLPNPIEFSDQSKINAAATYLDMEYGSGWIGSRALKAGAILHHGDIPQESREVLEDLLRQKTIQFGICTTTLAEGVNLPIRTLVLYSVKRIGKAGERTPLFIRDIKNLVGRAGRPGSNTKGLVICANQSQWDLVEAVALQASGEPVVGALRTLIETVAKRIADRQVDIATISNSDLESSPAVYSLIDGIDSTLIDLLAEEIGSEEFSRIAVEIADQTFAFQQTNNNAKVLLRNIFRLRAEKVFDLHSSGRIGWIKETGAKPRMVELVESQLVPLRTDWNSIQTPTDYDFVETMISWAWAQPDLEASIREVYGSTEIQPLKPYFSQFVHKWISGSNFVQLSDSAHLLIDDTLNLHTKTLSFVFQMSVEHAVSLLEKILLSREELLSPAVLKFPEHLRFGVASNSGLILANGGVRHRRAFVALGTASSLEQYYGNDRGYVFRTAMEILSSDRDRWLLVLGSLVLENTEQDLMSVIEVHE